MFMLAPFQAAGDRSAHSYEQGKPMLDDGSLTVHPLLDTRTIGLDANSVAHREPVISPIGPRLGVKLVALLPGEKERPFEWSRYIACAHRGRFIQPRHGAYDFLRSGEPSTRGSFLAWRSRTAVIFTGKCCEHAKQDKRGSR
jgi:hypothetical protein